MVITTSYNHTHPSHPKCRYFSQNKHVFWALVTVFSALTIILILLKLYRKVSEYQESCRQLRDNREQPRISGDSICAITIKQDYGNLAPPRYSDLTKYPVLSTYEEPPPYSPTPR